MIRRSLRRNPPPRLARAGGTGSSFVARVPRALREQRRAEDSHPVGTAPRAVHGGRGVLTPQTPPSPLECLSACGGERPNGTSGRKGRHALRPPLSTIMRLPSGAVASRGIPFRRVRSASGPFSATVGTGAHRVPACPPLRPRLPVRRRVARPSADAGRWARSEYLPSPLAAACAASAPSRRPCALRPRGGRAVPLARWRHGLFLCGARSARLRGAMTG